MACMFGPIQSLRAEVGPHRPPPFSSDGSVCPRGSLHPGTAWGWYQTAGLVRALEQCFNRMSWETSHWNMQLENVMHKKKLFKFNLVRQLPELSEIPAKKALGQLGVCNFHQNVFCGSFFLLLSCQKTIHTQTWKMYKEAFDMDCDLFLHHLCFPCL